MGKGHRKHKRALEIIAAHPEKFGLGHPYHYVPEMTLFEGKRVVAQPDLTFYMSDGKIRLVEYKENGHQEKALKQLTNAKWWYGRHRKHIDPNNIETFIISGRDYEKEFKELETNHL